MIVKLMGIADLMCIVWMILLYSGIIRWQSALWVVMYLLIKGLIFRGTFNSFMDKVIAAFVFFMFFGLHWAIGVIGASIWLGQRGVVSLF